MLISIIEPIHFNQSQLTRLKKIGTVNFYDYNTLSENEKHYIITESDVIVVNWIDPSPFILKMKQNSLVALLSTGYGWISNIQEAYDNSVFIANIPGYATESVAEHLLGLLLGVTKKIFVQLGSHEHSKEKGVTINGKTVGIIGLGRIGLRFSEILRVFYPNIITYNRTAKFIYGIEDVSLETLLTQSEIICITSSYNETSASLINVKNCGLIKDDAVIIGSTWGIISEKALLSLLSEKNICIAFDVALEGGVKLDDSWHKVYDDFIKTGRLYFTPHVAYNTVDAETRQLEICVSNIEHFTSGRMQNIVPR